MHIRKVSINMEVRNVKKILMVTESMGGGVLTYLAQLCNSLADDFDIYLAYSLRNEISPDYKTRLSSKIHLIELKYLGSKPITNIPNMFRVVKEFRQLEKNLSPDLIHLHSSIAGFFGRLAFNGRNNTVIYTPHGYAHVLSGPCMRSRIYRLVEKLLGYRNCITLTCCASEDEEAKTLTSKTAYIETGLDTSRLSRTLNNIQPTKQGKFTVFSLGRIVRQKRPDLFNKIAALVPEAKFIWIGGGPLSHELTAPNIEITGWMPREEALAIAKGADAFILCSYGEAIAMSLLENMYLGKLALVSNTMGNKSVIRNGINGWLCETPEDYAEKIREAMTNFPANITQSAQQSIENTYNMEAMKRKFIEYYSSLS